MQKKNERKTPTVKIVLTGGHAATTALATISSLKADDDISWAISWIGSKKAVEGKNSLTLEFREFPKLGIVCHEIVAGRIQRRFTRYSILALLKIPVGFLHAFYLLWKIQPKIILSFGGFAAFPVVVAGWVMRIPVVIHEQTIAIGLANKYSIPFASAIALSREESMKFFPATKSFLTGNPVRPEFYKLKHKARIGTPPVVLATGGSRGSQTFNNFVFGALPVLLQDYKVIHQSGDLDFERFDKFKRGLSANLQRKYELYSSIQVKDMPAFFEKADIIIGRSGANTVAEVIAIGRPAIFMPIPWSQHNEQTKNAKLAESSGLAKIIDQETGTPELLVSYIREVTKNWSKMVKSNNQKIHALDKDAASRVAHLCSDLVK